ncbi:MAG: biotin--[acetyl-CoA-carboxylase] ligase [Ilumatobacteraceae bacterium]
MDPLGATPRDIEPPDRWPHGWNVRLVNATGSTNTDLIGLAEAGAADRTVRVARHQTAGRGRLDRTWQAPSGANLLASLLLRDVPQHPHELTWRVGLAARAACLAVAGCETQLKWPNDLLLDGAKIAGILAQAGSSAASGAGPASGPYVVVGIGLNVRWAPPGAACLGRQFDPLDVLVEMLRAYDRLPADIWPVYRQTLHTLGREVRVELPDGSFVVGRAIDVERDGRLVVLDQCGLTSRFATADIVHLRAPG